MVIAVDFDGTIMNPENKNPGYRMGQPMPGAVAYLRKLHEQGHEIIIFTARNVNLPSAHKAVADWLEYYGIPHRGITNIKQPYFDVMIDNRAINFTGWSGIISKLQPYLTK